MQEQAQEQKHSHHFISRPSSLWVSVSGTQELKKRRNGWHWQWYLCHPLQYLSFSHT